MNDPSNSIESDQAARIRALEAELARLKGQSPDQPATSNTPLNDLVQGDKVEGDKAERDKVEAENVGFLITGDNNHVTHIIQQMRDIPLTPDEMRTEIGRYLSWVSNENRAITLQGIQDVRDPSRKYVTLDLETVYVPLRAYATPEQQRRLSRHPAKPDVDDLAEMRLAEESQREITLDEVLGLGKRLAITGGPGCGKTTVLMHLAWTLATALGNNDATLAQEKLQLTPPLPIPIFLPINRYADHLRQFAPIERRQRTLAAFISQYLIERQSSLELPADFFRQLLAQGTHVILLLDGLDEVSSEAEREQVVQAVQDLVRGHEQLRVVVTCRTAAYRGIDQFRELRVQPLNESHITDLVTNAYRYVYAGSPERQRAQTADLLNGIRQLEAERQQRLGERAERLISSPLLVRMMLIVHISERKLPDQRAELYLKATENLLEPTYARDVHVQQDIGRMIGGDRALEMVQYIAYQMHGRGSEQGREITERELEALLRAHPTCANLTDTFLSITRQRGTVMETIGETYRFIHLGFQELLAARYMDDVLLRRHTLSDVLQDKLQDSWWREPLLLLPGYCVADKGSSRADTIIRYLAGLDGGDLSTGSRNLRWHTAALAATALYEWRDAPASLRQDMLDRLLALLEEEAELGQKSRWQRWFNRLNTPQATEPLESANRLALGIALGQLGDPRPGVGVNERGVPDIVWGNPVPVGMYTVGDGRHDDQKIQHVPIKEAYQLAKYPITNAQFAAFVNAPDFDAPTWWEGMPEKGKNWDNKVYMTKEIFESTWPTANHPRTDVSWYQAVAFCRWLSDKLGYEVRLPHEHEWEVAARYGHGKAYPWGDDTFDQTKLNAARSVGQTTAVGLYPTGRQTELDLYDMSGNVFEWCQNKYEEPEDTAVDSSHSGRVLRGGSWNFNLEYARVSFRYGNYPYLSSYLIGFRAVAPIVL